MIRDVSRDHLVLPLRPSIVHIRHAERCRRVVLCSARDGACTGCTRRGVHGGGVPRGVLLSYSAHPGSSWLILALSCYPLPVTRYPLPVFLFFSASQFLSFSELSPVLLGEKGTEKRCGGKGNVKRKRKRKRKRKSSPGGQKRLRSSPEIPSNYGQWRLAQEK